MVLYFSSGDPSDIDAYQILSGRALKVKFVGWNWVY